MKKATRKLGKSIASQLRDFTNSTPVQIVALAQCSLTRAISNNTQHEVQNKPSSQCHSQQQVRG